MPSAVEVQSQLSVLQLGLPDGLEAGSLHAVRLSGKGVWYLAVGADGSSALVVQTSENAQAVASVRLQGLAADFDVLVDIVEASKRTVVRGAIIRMVGPRAGAADLFASLVSSLWERCPGAPGSADLAAELDRWSRFFWRLSQPGSVSATGLAGELVAIAASGFVDDWLSAWHAKPEDQFDFVFLPSRVTVEVKSSASDRRMHEVSLWQIAPENIERRFFASVRIVPGSCSMRSLVGDLQDRAVLDESRVVLWDGLTATCGSSIDDFLAFSIDYEIATHSLLFVSGGSIPAPTVGVLPAGVSRVHFTSDFTLADVVDPEVVSQSVRQTGV